MAGVLKYIDLGSPPERIRFRTSQPASVKQMADGNSFKLQHLIRRRYFRLLRAFEEVDVAKTGVISQDECQAVLSRVLRLPPIDWAQHLGGGHLSHNQVKYAAFLRQHARPTEDQQGTTPDVSFRHASGVALRSLYANFDTLKTVFQEWDSNQNGKINREELAVAIDALNKAYPGHDPLDAEELFDLLDFEGSGTLNINDLLESSRMSL